MVEKQVQRKLAAILAADVAGYSRLMGEDEDATLAVLTDHTRELIAPCVAEHRGRIVKSTGDGFLAKFGSVIDAVQCAVAVQHGMRQRNAAAPDAPQMRFRIGVNLGDVIVQEGDIYGTGVNIAARLEGLATPGGICVSGTVYDAVGDKVAMDFAFMGERTAKNIDKPLRVYRVVGQDPTDGRPTSTSGSDQQSAHAQTDQPSLAIKPFENVGADPEQDHLAEGVTYGLIVALMKVHGLTLIGDDSPLMALSQQMTVQELGRRFDVQYVLKGSVRKSGDRTRVNAELIDVSTGQYLWAEQYDRVLHDLGELFAIQDEIIEEIVTAMDVQLLSGEAGRLVRRAFRNPIALERYYHGERLLWRAGTKVEFQEVHRLLEDVMRLEPTASVGFANDALAYWIELFCGLSDEPSRTMERATELARQALSLRDVTGYPHLVLAEIHLRRREYDKAAIEAEQAVLARPSCSFSYSLKAGVLTYLGRPEEAIDYARYAVRLTPVHPPMYPAILATAYYGSGRHEEAVAAAHSAIELDEHGVNPYLILAASGHAEEAQRAARKVRDLEPDFDLSDFAATQPYKDQKHLDGLLAQLRSAGLG